MSLKEMIRSLKKSSRSQKLIRKRSNRKQRKSKSKRKQRRSRRKLDGNEVEWGCKVPKSFI